MSTELIIPSPTGALPTGSGFILPAVIADQGYKTAERFFTFFTDTIRNKNMRAAYYRNAMRFFARRLKGSFLFLPEALDFWGPEVKGAFLFVAIDWVIWEGSVCCLEHLFDHRK